LLDGTLNDYGFIKNSNKNIDGVDDAAEFASIIVTFGFMALSFTSRNLSMS
jgi:myosin heavy subunit